MKILVVGANGLIGRLLVESMSKKNLVFALINIETTPRFKVNENIKVIYHNLVNLDTYELPIDIDSVIYLAQSKKFRVFPEGCLDVLMVNTLSAVKLAKWASENRVKKFIYASTGGVYSNIKLQGVPIKEDAVINSNEKITFYACSKISAEMLLRSFSNCFETFAIIRPFFVYGPGQDRSMLIPRLIENIILGREIILTNEEGIKLNPIYVSDAVEAIISIFNLKGEHTFNIAGDEIVSLKQLCLLIEEATGKNSIFKNVGDFQYDLIGDNTLMRNLLHIPRVSLNEGIKNILEVDFNEDDKHI